MEKIIFFAMPRTASRSLAYSLNRQLGGRLQYVGHASISDARAELQAANDKDVFKFCFVRNPFTRLLSAYRWIMQRRKMSDLDMLQRKGMDKYKTYNDFCLHLKEFVSDPLNSAIHFYPQHQWITLDDGTCAMDYIGRFENINESLGNLAQLLNVSHLTVDRRRQQPLLEKIKLVSFRERYFDSKANASLSDAAIDSIREFYRLDFEQFNYSDEYTA